MHRSRSFLLPSLSCWISRRRIARDFVSAFEEGGQGILASSFLRASARRRSRPDFSSNKLDCGRRDRRFLSSRRRQTSARTCEVRFPAYQTRRRTSRYRSLSCSWRGSPPSTQSRTCETSISRFSSERMSVSRPTIFSEIQRWGSLAAKEDVEQGVDCSDFSEGKQGHHRGAGDREPEPNLVAPCELHQADEIFHNFRRMPRT